MGNDTGSVAVGGVAETVVVFFDPVLVTVVISVVVKPASFCFVASNASGGVNGSKATSVKVYNFSRASPNKITARGDCALKAVGLFFTVSFTMASISVSESETSLPFL